MTTASLLIALALASQEELGADLERVYRAVTERAAPWVVAIKVDREPEAEPAAESGPRRSLERLLRGGAPPAFSRRPPQAWCSGTILEADGLVVTTHFNVSGKLKSILVRLHDGRELPGQLLGFNGTFDLAAVKIDAEGLPTPRMSRLQALKSGHTVLALGIAPGGRGLTVNPGVLSAPSRMAGRGLQTDAKLNFGNVGGPLVDDEGCLVAVTCKVDTRRHDDWGQNSGVGFAVTHDRLSEVLPDLKAGKNVVEARRAFLGIQPNMERTDPGVELSVVQAGSAAEKAGLKTGDVLTAFEGKKIDNFDELRAAITRRAPGDRVKLTILRGKEELEIECELGWAPE